MRQIKINKKTFNILINGVGGQGQLTLLKILREAALLENYDLKTSELHGLSQRGGGVEVHLRMGKKVASPLIPYQKADLVLALELQEALRALKYAHPKTFFLVNEEKIVAPQVKNLSFEEVIKEIKKISPQIEVVPASKLCREKLNNDLVAGVYLLSWAVHKKLIPLSPSSLEMAIKKIIPPDFLNLNLAAFNLAKNL